MSPKNTVSKKYPLDGCGGHWILGFFAAVLQFKKLLPDAVHLYQA